MWSLISQILIRKIVKSSNLAFVSPNVDFKQLYGCLLVQRTFVGTFRSIFGVLAKKLIFKIWFILRLGMVIYVKIPLKSELEKI